MAIFDSPLLTLISTRLLRASATVIFLPANFIPFSLISNKVEYNLSSADVMIFGLLDDIYTFYSVLPIANYDFINMWFVAGIDLNAISEASFIAGISLKSSLSKGHRQSVT